MGPSIQKPTAAEFSQLCVTLRKCKPATGTQVEWDQTVATAMKDTAGERTRAQVIEDLRKFVRALPKAKV